MRNETELPNTERSPVTAERRGRVLQIVVREVKKFGTLFLYLALVFGLFRSWQGLADRPWARWRLPRAYVSDFRFWHQAEVSLRSRRVRLGPNFGHRC